MPMLSWEDYWKRFIDVFIQFDLARKAISGFRDTPEAVKKYAEEEFENLRKDVQNHFEQQGLNPHNTWMYENTKVEKYLEDTMSSVPTRLKHVENRINQNQLIIQVALFETFMKDIHREVLRRNPGLINPDKKVSIGRIVSEGLNSIIEEEIEREVHGLDRKSIEERCEYFKSRLAIDWSFDGTVLPPIKAVLESRNAILHEKPDLEVTEIELTLGMSILIGIPMVALVQAHLHYPDTFAAPDQLDNLMKHFKNKIEAKGKTNT